MRRTARSGEEGRREVEGGEAEGFAEEGVAAVELMEGRRNGGVYRESGRWSVVSCVSVVSCWLREIGFGVGGS